MLTVVKINPCAIDLMKNGYILSKCNEGQINLKTVSKKYSPIHIFALISK